MTKPVLAALGAVLDAGRVEIRLAEIDAAVPLKVAASGRCQLNLCEMASELSWQVQAAEVDVMAADAESDI